VNDVTVWTAGLYVLAPKFSINHEQNLLVKIMLVKTQIIG
jgi:hypothetical protein